MNDRWATFDCYGTLIDWKAGITAVLRQLWPDHDSAALLTLYHHLEPVVQAGRDLTYREVGARTLRGIAAIEDLTLDDRDAYALASSLPTWPAFPEVPAALTQLRRSGWRLAILSNTDPDLLTASVEQIGVPFDQRITAGEAGSYKPAYGHWEQFFARTGADRTRHVHVAASPFHDLAPSARLKIPAVWINRLADYSDQPRAAELPDLSQLPDVLDKLVPR